MFIQHKTEERKHEKLKNNSINFKSNRKTTNLYRKKIPLAAWDNEVH